MNEATEPVTLFLGALFGGWAQRILDELLQGDELPLDLGNTEFGQQLGFESSTEAVDGSSCGAVVLGWGTESGSMAACWVHHGPIQSRMGMGMLRRVGVVCSGSQAGPQEPSTESAEIAELLGGTSAGQPTMMSFFGLASKGSIQHSRVL